MHGKEMKFMSGFGSDKLDSEQLFSIKNNFKNNSFSSTLKLLSFIFFLKLMNYKESE